MLSTILNLNQRLCSTWDIADADLAQKSLCQRRMAESADKPIGSGVQYQRANGSGLADGTKKNNDLATRYFNIFAGTKELATLEELVAARDTVLCDVGLWQELGTWMHTYARQLTDQSKHLKHETALNYLSSIVGVVSRTFPGHETFQKHSFDTWYADLRKDVTNQILRREIREGDDDGDESQDVTPEIVDRLCKRWNLEGSPESLTKALAVALTSACVGRPGEYVYISVEKMRYNHALKTLDLWWSDRKNLKQYIVALCVSAHKYRCAVFALGGHLIVGGTSAARSAVNAKGQFIFAKQAQTQDTAAAYLNNAVKEGMAWEVTPAELPLFVGKSIRRGSVTHLLLHPKLQRDLLVACCMGNWELQCRMFKYFGEAGKETKRSIASRALAGWPNVYNQPIPPRFVLNDLLTKTVIERMVLYAYGEHLPDMGPGQRLFEVGHLLLAVEVMWLDDTITEVCGARPLTAEMLSRLPLRVKALLDVAQKAGLGTNRTRLGMMELLKAQSINIYEQFHRENSIDQVNHSPQQQPLDMVVCKLAELQRENHELKKVYLFYVFILFFSIAVLIFNFLPLF